MVVATATKGGWSSQGDFLTDSDKLTYGLEAKNQNEYFDLNKFVWGMNNFGKAKK